jgi:hypothetical protein
MAQWRKKPVTIEAVQWTGDNYEECVEFLGEDSVGGKGGELYIDTIEGVMTAKKGDFLIQGVKGEHYSCREDIFYQTYDQV